MIDRVLVPINGSEMATRALEYALEVHPDAEITLLYVAGEPSAMMGQALRLALEEDLDEALEELAADVFEPARELAAECDAEVDTDVGVGSPARVIVNRADEFDAVVIGSHGGDLQSRLFVGNVAERVFRLSPVPVTAVR